MPELTEKQVVFDSSAVRKLRKDYLLLMRNLDRVTSARAYENFKAGVRTFALHVMKVFVGDWGGGDDRNPTKTALYKLGASDHDIEYVTSLVNKAVYTFEYELTSTMPDWYKWSATTRPGAKNTDAVRWRKRADRAARKMWSDLESASRHFQKIGQGRTAVVGQSEEKFEVAGINVRVLGEPLLYPKAFMSGMKDAAERLKRTLPWAWQYRLPVAVRDLDIDTGGRYNRRRPGTTYVDMSRYLRSPRAVSKVYVHEMGHHLFKQLGREAQEAWNAAVRSDSVDLNIRKLLDEWPDDELSLLGYSDKVKKSDPTLSLQLTAILAGWAKPQAHRKGDLESLLRSGTTSIRVPAHPVTAYSAKNPEEAFCEALMGIVSFGSHAVHPLVKSLLRRVLGSRLKLSEATMDTATPTKAPWHTCTDCAHGIPKYVGRYPQTCPNCGCRLTGQAGYPSLKRRLPRRTADPSPGIPLEERQAFNACMQSVAEGVGFPGLTYAMTEGDVARFRYAPSHLAVQPTVIDVPLDEVSIPSVRQAVVEAVEGVGTLMVDDVTDEDMLIDPRTKAPVPTSEPLAERAALSTTFFNKVRAEWKRELKPLFTKGRGVVATADEDESVAMRLMEFSPSSFAFLAHEVPILPTVSWWYDDYKSKKAQTAIHDKFAGLMLWHDKMPTASEAFYAAKATQFGELFEAFRKALNAALTELRSAKNMLRPEVASYFARGALKSGPHRRSAWDYWRSTDPKGFARATKGIEDPNDSRIDAHLEKQLSQMYLSSQQDNLTDVTSRHEDLKKKAESILNAIDALFKFLKGGVTTAGFETPMQKEIAQRLLGRDPKRGEKLALATDVVRGNDNVAGFRVTNDAGLEKYVWERFAKVLALVARGLKRKGLGFLVKRLSVAVRPRGGRTVTVDTTGEEVAMGGGYKYGGVDAPSVASLPAKKGTKPYRPSTPTSIGRGAISMYVDEVYRMHEQETAVVFTHEIGHHYYFAFLPPKSREAYKVFFQRATSFPSAYAKNNAGEDFAEIFTAWVLKGTGLMQNATYKPLDRDMMQRFKAAIEMDPKAKGVKLHEAADDIWERVKGSLGMPRAKMPQIRSDLVPEFIAYLGKNDVKVRNKAIPASKLKPTQDELNKSKLDYMATKGTEQLLKPMIVSSDNYVLDGHHRLGALRMKAPNAQVPAVVVDLHIVPLLALAHKFAKVGYKKLSEAIGGPNPVPAVNPKADAEDVPVAPTASTGVGSSFNAALGVNEDAGLLTKLKNKTKFVLKVLRNPKIGFASVTPTARADNPPDKPLQLNFFTPQMKPNPIPHIYVANARDALRQLLGIGIQEPQLAVHMVTEAEVFAFIRGAWLMESKRAKYRSAIAIVVRNRVKGPAEVLIGKAGETDDDRTGTWCLPGGGISPDDADEHAAAAREAWEEMGVTAEPTGKSVEMPGRPGIVFCYLDYVEGEPKPNAKFTAAKWLPVADAWKAKGLYSTTEPLIQRMSGEMKVTEARKPKRWSDLTPTQEKVLTRIIREFADNRKRLKGAIGGIGEWEAGVVCGGEDLPARTVRALWDMGLIDCKVESSERSELRRGAYGKWISGSKTRTDTSVTAKPVREVIRALYATRKLSEAFPNQKGSKDASSGGRSLVGGSPAATEKKPGNSYEKDEGDGGAFDPADRDRTGTVTQADQRASKKLDMPEPASDEMDPAESDEAQEDEQQPGGAPQQPGQPQTPTGPKSILLRFPDERTAADANQWFKTMRVDVNLDGVELTATAKDATDLEVISRTASAYGLELSDAA